MNSSFFPYRLIGATGMKTRSYSDGIYNDA